MTNMNYKRNHLAAEDETARGNNLYCFYLQFEMDTYKEYLDIHTHSQLGGVVENLK